MNMKRHALCIYSNIIVFLICSKYNFYTYLATIFLLNYNHAEFQFKMKQSVTVTKATNYVSAQ